MSVQDDQALVRAASDLRRDHAKLKADLERASHPNELDQLWRTHPLAEYIIETIDGAYVASAYPRDPLPERGFYGKAYLTAAEAIARSIVESHNRELERAE